MSNPIWLAVYVLIGLVFLVVLRRKAAGVRVPLNVGVFVVTYWPVAAAVVLVTLRRLTSMWVARAFASAGMACMFASPIAALSGHLLPCLWLAGAGGGLVGYAVESRVDAAAEEGDA